MKTKPSLRKVASKPIQTLGVQLQVVPLVDETLQAFCGGETVAIGGKALKAMRKPAVGCFVAGTLAHTKEGFKPIEQLKVGDWVLSRPENPEQGTETGYKRVTKTFRFEDKEVINFVWAHRWGDDDKEGRFGNVFVTPNHPVWSYPHGWVAMGRMHDGNRRIPGTIPRRIVPEDFDYSEPDPWLGRDLVQFDGSPGERYDVLDIYKTNKTEVAFLGEDDWGFGTLIDFSNEKIAFGEDMPYDYEKWGDSDNETRERYCTTVYNIEVEDWHTYFVSELGLWVHE